MCGLLAVTEHHDQLVVASVRSITSRLTRCNDVVSMLEQRLDDPCPDEAGGAGDEYFGWRRDDRHPIEDLQLQLLVEL